MQLLSISFKKVQICTLNWDSQKGLRDYLANNETLKNKLSKEGVIKTITISISLTELPCSEILIIFFNF